jgi:flagellar secretion chaperone FliS
MTTIDDDRTEELRQRYLQTQVETATPVQRLLMLQNRLVQDLRAAEEAYGTASIESVHRNLVHAQQIVLVLRDSLKGSDWAGAEPLRAVYWFVYQRLIDCNMAKDRSLLPMCITLVDRIVEANTKAAADVAQPADSVVQVA